jgi:hypothetical protein
MTSCRTHFIVKSVRFPNSISCLSGLVLSPGCSQVSSMSHFVRSIKKGEPTRNIRPIPRPSRITSAVREWSYPRHDFHLFNDVGVFCGQESPLPSTKRVLSCELFCTDNIVIEWHKTHFGSIIELSKIFKLCISWLMLTLYHHDARAY